MQEIWPPIDHATFCRPLKMIKASKEKDDYGLFLINHCHITKIYLNAEVANCDVAIFSQTPHGQCNRYKRRCLRSRLLSGILKAIEMLQFAREIGPHEKVDTVREDRTNRNR